MGFLVITKLEPSGLWWTFALIYGSADCPRTIQESSQSKYYTFSLKYGLSFCPPSRPSCILMVTWIKLSYHVSGVISMDIRYMMNIRNPPVFIYRAELLTACPLGREMHINMWVDTWKITRQSVYHMHKHKNVSWVCMEGTYSGADCVYGHRWTMPREIIHYTFPGP